MPELRDRLLQAELSVASPHGVLQLAGTGAGDLAVTVLPGALQGWTDAALEREISGLIDAALRAARRTYVRVRRDVFEPDRAGEDEPVDDADAPDADQPADAGEQQLDPWRSQPRAERFRDAVDGIQVQGASQRGYITVTRDESHQFQVTVRRGTLRRLPEPELATEIGTALAAAQASYHQGYQAAFRSTFGSDPGFSLREGHHDRRPH